MPIDLADAVVGKFIEFVKATVNESDNRIDLSSFFSAWATEGDAVDECGGNYALYLRTFFYAIARFEEDRTVFGRYVPDRIMSDAYWQTLAVIEPEDWERMAYNRLRGLPAVLPNTQIGRSMDLREGE